MTYTVYTLENPSLIPHDAKTYDNIPLAATRGKVWMERATVTAGSEDRAMELAVMDWPGKKVSVVPAD